MGRCVPQCCRSQHNTTCLFFMESTDQLGFKSPMAGHISTTLMNNNYYITCDSSLHDALTWFVGSTIPSETPPHPWRYGNPNTGGIGLRCVSCLLQNLSCPIVLGAESWPQYCEACCCPQLQTEGYKHPLASEERQGEAKMTLVQPHASPEEKSSKCIIVANLFSVTTIAHFKVK